MFALSLPAISGGFSLLPDVVVVALHLLAHLQGTLIFGVVQPQLDLCGQLLDPCHVSML